MTNGQTQTDPDEHAPRVCVALADLQEPGAITRNEEDDTVRYGNVLLLAPGVWGDAGSGKRIYYSPDGIANSADNWEDDTVNLFHEQDNEVTEVGHVDEESIFLGEDDGGLYGDIVLEMDNSASEFADDALQNALETNGREGLQGPSVELRGEEYRYNDDKGVHELVEGTFNGLGLVGLGVSPGPGSKDAAFAEQTRDRAVALASDADASVFTRTPHMDITQLRERLESANIQLADDADEEELRALADALDIDLQDDDDDDESDEADGDDAEVDDSDDSDDEPDEDTEMSLEDVAGRVDEIGDQVTENSERIDEMAARFEDLDDDSSLADLFDKVSKLTSELETLADAEELEELENRLQAIEDEPEEPTSLADIGETEPPADEDDPVRIELGSGAPGKPRVR